MDSFERFNETSLPDKKCFYSELSKEHISDIDYLRALIVWKTFNLNNMGEYHDLYLNSDVFLLTDILQNFRDLSMKDYGLDPVYYYTLPNFAWDTMLKITNIKLDRLTDMEMYVMIEKGLRGGICQVVQKHVKANNKYMENYDDEKINNFIAYLDANNLYGHAMVRSLPSDSFRWLSQKEIDSFDKVIDKYKETDNSGYILEVDLSYDRELHDAHSDYPLLSERMSVSKNMISPYMNDVAIGYTGKDFKSEKNEKLILNLYDKEDYVIHISMLKFVKAMGIKIKKNKKSY